MTKEEQSKITNNPTKEELNRVIQEINKTKTDKIARSERTRQILYAYGKRKSEIQIRRPLREPVLFFRRRSGKTEIYEAVTGGRWDFKHSNGDDRFIIIDPSSVEYLSTGKDQIRYYDAHEDHPVTGWPDPITTTEQINIFVEKTLADQRDWMLKDKKLKNQMWLYIAAAIALVLIAYGLMKGMLPTNTTNIIVQATNNTLNETVKAAANYVINNGSTII